MLGGAELVEVSSDGEPGDKTRFVRGVEGALLDGRAEVAVHSAKDLPAELTEGLSIAAVPEREDAADVWIGGKGSPTSLSEVPEGARVGTASLRRRAQLLAARPDLRVEELHGNVDTRLRKLAEGKLDAIVLAAAGLRRLGREAEATFRIDETEMVPCAGQGALVVQTRAGDEAGGPVAEISEWRALVEVTAERAAVALLGATCASPIGVHAQVEETGSSGEAAEAAENGDAEAAPAEGLIRIESFVGLPDGSEWLRDRVEADAAEPALAGALLAKRLADAGAREILERAEEM